MQAIARVNRVFRDKPAGLVVDYIGVAQKLKNALGQYSRPDQEQTGIDEKAIAVLSEKHEIVRAMFAPDVKGGFDYRPALVAGASPKRVCRSWPARSNGYWRSNRKRHQRKKAMTERSVR